MSTQTAAELLERAAEILAERGHHKGGYVAMDSPKVCAAGAVNTAWCEHYRPLRDRHDWPMPPVIAPSREAEDVHVAMLDRLHHAIYGGDGRRINGWDVAEIASWNDLPETSAEDVILALKRAAGDAS